MLPNFNGRIRNLAFKKCPLVQEEESVCYVIFEIIISK